MKKYFLIITLFSLNNCSPILYGERDPVLRALNTVRDVATVISCNIGTCPYELHQYHNGYRYPLRRSYQRRPIPIINYRYNGINYWYKAITIRRNVYRADFTVPITRGQQENYYCVARHNHSIYNQCNTYCR